MSNDARRKLLIVLAGCGVGLFLLDAAVLRPLGNAWQSQGERIATGSQQVERGNALLDRRDSTSGRWKSMKDGSLPKDTAKAESLVLSAIGNWAGRSGLTVSNIRPRWVVMKNVGDRFEVRLSADGDLERVTRFIYELETDSLPLAVEETLIRSKTDSGDDLSLELRFSALRIGGTGA
ncbi:hypothetical protein GC173_05870 [bacterium]|nr:hypothetical protein [bacterium]